MQFNEMVAASPSGVAAALSLGTDSIPFNNTSGPFLDLGGSGLYLHSGIRRVFSTEAGANVLPRGRHLPRRGVTRGGADGARVASRSWPQAADTEPGGAPLVRERGEGSEWSSLGGPRPDGGNLGMWRAAVTAWRPRGGPGEPLPGSTGDRGLGLAGPAGRPGALGTGKRARRGGGGLAAFSFH